jgi:mannose-6-phosphate isomerase
MEAEEDVQKGLIEAALDWAEEASSVEGALIRKFHSYFGDDIGVLSPLYLNVVNLPPGHALFQPAGVLHAYVEGMGVELMANSDNVLRGGLTTKHVDVPELMRVLDFTPRSPDIITPELAESGRERYPVPIDEFVLLRLSSDTNQKVTLDRRSSLEIGICTKGNFSLQIDAREDGSSPRNRKRYIGQGESFVIPYGVSSYTLSGTGEIYFATVPFAVKE